MQIHYSFAPQFILYKKRFLVLILAGITYLLLTFQQLQYVIIANIVKRYYDVGDQAVLWTVMVMYVWRAFLLFISTWFLYAVGLRVTFVTVTLLLCISTIVKLFSINENLFWLAIVAQAIAGVSEALNSPFPLTVSRVWFPNHQINRATVIVDLFGIVGIMLTSSLTMFVPNSDKSEIAHAFSVLFVVQAIVAFVLFLSVILFFDEKPETAPSYSESVVTNLRGDVPVLHYFRELMTPNLLILLLVFGLNTSFGVSFNALLNQTFMTKLDDTRLVGLTLVLSTLLKMINEYFVSDILDLRHNFKVIICATFAVSAFLYLCYALSLYSNSDTIIIISATFLGSTLGMNSPTLLNFGAELTYPAPEMIINNSMVFSSQIFAIIFTPINSAFISYFGVVVTNIQQCCLMLFVMILTLFIQSNLRRQMQEEESHCLLIN